MRLTVVSFFRDSERSGQIDHFFKQVAALQHVWRGPLKVVATYGDCVDQTAEALQSANWDYGVYTELNEASHGGPRYGSIESEGRFTALSMIANAALEKITIHDEMIWYVESDLVWEPKTVMVLADHLVTKPHVGVVAPMVYAGPHFYDVWGFRGLDGERFSPFPPYHRSMTSGLVEVSSVGSALMMRASVARESRIRNNGALVGFCEDVRRNGYQIYVDPTAKVVHP